MKKLVIVDFQRDFVNSQGALYVNGAENAQKAIVHYINKHYDELDEVIFTIDWHPTNHCSFKNNGGIWPNHCVQYSEGAGIVSDLVNVCNFYALPVKIFIKGNICNQEEYGAFSYVEEDNNEINCSNVFGDSEVNFNKNDEVVVCGLAGDFCVKSTIENLLKCKDLNIEILKDGIASIDDGSTLNNFISENNLLVETI